MDAWILITGTAAFILFLVSLIVVFRLTRKQDALSWIVRMALLCGCIVCIMGGKEALLVYTLETFLYIFTVFSVFEASLTIRFLIEIAQTGERGINADDLLKRFNRQMIIQRRIERFLRSGDLVEDHTRYRMNTRASYFQLRELMINELRWLFPV